MAGYFSTPSERRVHPLVIFFVGFSAGFTACYFPRFVVFAARQTNAFDVKIFDPFYFYLSLFFSCLAGVVCMLVFAGIRCKIKRLFFTSLGLPALLTGSFNTSQTATISKFKLEKTQAKLDSMLILLQKNYNIHNSELRLLQFPDDWKKGQFNQGTISPKGGVEIITAFERSRYLLQLAEGPDSNALAVEIQRIASRNNLKSLRIQKTDKGFVLASGPPQAKSEVTLRAIALKKLGFDPKLLLFSSSTGTPSPKHVEKLSQTFESENTVSNSMDAVNIYFSWSAETGAALPKNRANQNINIENRILKRIYNAKKSIDLATFDITLDKMVSALTEKAAQGVIIRVIADGKDPASSSTAPGYELTRITLEKLLRGKDGKPGTADDIALFADSPVFAVADKRLRTRYGLPPTPADLNFSKKIIGRHSYKGRVVAEGERKGNGKYYPFGEKMRHNFLAIDKEWVITGSPDLTVEGIYGSADNLAKGVIDGRQQHMVEIHSPKVAGVFRRQFNEMWGSVSAEPRPWDANFHDRKIPTGPGVFSLKGRRVEILFSPTHSPVTRLANLVDAQAENSLHFTVHAWSHQMLVNACKRKWEGSLKKDQSTLTGFKLEGVFDGLFWNRWWSAAVDMTGRKSLRSTSSNRNIRWAHPAPVCRYVGSSRLQGRALIIDAASENAVTAVSSIDWTENGNQTDDGCMLLLHGRPIANQFYQEFLARKKSAACDG